jgi:Domain of unknown function (DUF222)/HNH endonuclease
MFDVLDELEQAVEKIAAHECAADVVRMRRMIERLEHAWLRHVRDAEVRGDWLAEGFMNTASWLRERCRMTHGAAAASVSLARSLERLPHTADAFANGDISRAHAQVIARSATDARVAELAQVESSLMQVAAASSPSALRGVVQYVTDALDGDGGARSAAQRHEQRHLHVSPTLDGMVAIDGMLDPEGGEVVLSALERAMEAARSAGDQRTRAQQRADAMVELCRVGVAHHATGPGRRHRPHLSVVVDLDVVEQRAGAELVRQVRADVDHVGRLSAATIERLSCDASIARVITQGRSAPLDVGRSTRTIPAALWRALVVRDGGCVVPGCDRPPGWCEVHHRIPWSRGGTTSLGNCELRCWRHHHAAHEGEHRREHRAEHRSEYQGANEPPDP